MDVSYLIQVTYQSLDCTVYHKYLPHSFNPVFTETEKPGTYIISLPGFFHKKPSDRAMRRVS